MSLFLRKQPGMEYVGETAIKEAIMANQCNLFQMTFSLPLYATFCTIPVFLSSQG